MKYTSLAGPSVIANFSGSYLALVARVGPTYGKARITLDGGVPVLVDFYGPSFLSQVQVWNTGTLANGSHTVQIEATGQKNPASSYTYVDVDAVEVAGTLTAGSSGVGAQI